MSEAIKDDAGAAERPRIRVPASRLAASRAGRRSPARWFLLGAALAAAATATVFVASRRDHGSLAATLGAACHRGDPVACREAGLVLARGIEGKPDLKAGEELLKRACDGGDAHGCRALAELVDEGRAAWDPGRVIALFQRACDGNDAPACAELAKKLDKGVDVAHDAAKAAALYDKGCKLGSAAACTGAGLQRLLGAGVEKDPEQATALFQKACDGGDADGCHGLGRMLLRGQGGKRDEARAKELLVRSCEGGSVAGCRAASLLFDGDPAKAARYRARACALGDPTSCEKVIPAPPGSARE